MGQVTSDPPPGTLIDGRYRVVGKIGSGAMGHVLEAEQEGIGRRVAIKVLRSEHALSEEHVARFLREARVAGQLGHPHLVPIHDLGRLSDGRPFLVMPRLYGRSLRELVDEGPTPPARVVQWLRGVADGLDRMHEQGIVHRDIKPDNLFLDARTHQVVLLDFGLATLMSGKGRVTARGMVCGTPSYVPPEAAYGEVSDARGDVYSLAVVAFELIAGLPPFVDDVDPVRLLTRKLREAPPTLRAVSGTVFPAALEAALASALSADPDRRPGTARELVAALEAAATPPPAEDSTPIPLTGIVRPVLGGRAIAGLFAAATAVAVLVGLTTIAEAPREPAPGGPSPAAVATPAVPFAPAAVELAAAPSGAVSSSAPPASRAPPAPPRGARPAPPPPSARVETEAPPIPADDRERAARLTREATTALAHGLLPHAAQLYWEASVAAPGYAAPWRGMGIAHERMGRRPEAIRAYDRYLRLAPGAADADEIRARLAALR